ncbi:MAG: FAD-dependent thymidylate synthase, partial [Pseudonocardiaceae bacterium]
MHPYAREHWTEPEAEVLARHFTNLDGPVFALVNLPEVVKGALFARYSRSSKSLRRLFLDEFAEDLAGISASSSSLGLQGTAAGGRAERLYERVFSEYGDDSVAQLGGAHLACEQTSNILTKILEWGRLMAYLEQSTRYIAYDDRLGGRFRYYRDPEIVGSPLGMRYIGDLDFMFDTYARLIPVLVAFHRDRIPKEPGDSEGVYQRAIKAKALDDLRGLLPAASLSNLGIYGTGQGYEALLV